MKTVLITGTAGFIGFHLTEKLIKKKYEVIGIDNLSGKYSANNYKKVLNILRQYNAFKFYKYNILDQAKVDYLVKKYLPIFIIHCAGKTGVMASFNNSSSCLKTNVLGTQIVLESLRQYSSKSRVILMSSSSVYGNQRIPFNEDFQPNPISPYGLSKFLMELVAKYYYSNFKIPIVIARLFSVYGPRGRRDMAPFLMVKSALDNKPFIKYGNNQNNQRDWTYINDVVNILVKIIEKYDFRRFEIFNIGSGKPIGINNFIKEMKSLIKEHLNKEVQIVEKSKRDKEMSITYADVTKLKKTFHTVPKTDFHKGILSLLDWY